MDLRQPTAFGMGKGDAVKQDSEDIEETLGTAEPQAQSSRNNYIKATVLKHYQEYCGLARAELWPLDDSKLFGFLQWLREARSQLRGKSLKPSTIMSYCSLLKSVWGDMWRANAQMRAHSYDPVGYKTRRFMTDLAASIAPSQPHQQEQERRVDRLMKSATQGVQYSHSDLYNITWYWLMKKSYLGVQYWAMFLLGMGTALSTQARLSTKLCNFRSAKVTYCEPQQKLPSEMELLVCVRQSAKPPSTSAPEMRSISKRVITPILRNRDPLLCPWNGVAMVLFYRHHVCGMASPDFSDMRWLESPVFFANPDPAVNQSEKALQDQLSVVMTDLQIMHEALQLQVPKDNYGDWTKNTIVAMQKRMGIVPTDDPIRSVIREKYTVDHTDKYTGGLYDLDGNTYDNIDFDALTCLAGLDANADGIFPPRCRVTPPAELARQVFPWIEMEFDIWSVESRANFSTGRTHQTFVNYLTLMIEFRKIILQDAAQLLSDPRMSFLHDHPMYQHRIFKSKNFLDYKEEVRNALSGIWDRALSWSPPNFNPASIGQVGCLGKAARETGEAKSQIDLLDSEVMKSLEPTVCDLIKQQDEQLKRIAAKLDKLIQRDGLAV